MISSSWKKSSKAKFKNSIKVNDSTSEKKEVLYMLYNNLAAFLSFRQDVNISVLVGGCLKILTKDTAGEII